MSTSAHPIDRLWLAISSPRTTALLTTALALFAAVAAVVPQGSDAIRMVQFEHATDLRRLAAWGLTEVFESAWIRAVGILLLANIAAVIVRSLPRRDSHVDTTLLPSAAPHESELNTSLPERAVEALRSQMRAALGTAPTSETVEGAKVTMVFDTSRRGDLLPLLAHLGLILLVIGAGLLVAPPAPSQAVVRAQLAVTNSKDGFTGYFDVAENEPIKFFQWRSDFVVRNYVASKNGLGPAIEIERVDSGAQGRRTRFWVYQNAPAGFDQRHRRGMVSIEVVSAGLQAAPGYGMASNPASSLLLFGLALILIGALGSSRAAGRLWVQAEGDTVRILGVPRRAGDGAFAKSFGRLELLCRAALGHTA